MLIYIAAWPVKRIQHRITLLQARSIENLAYVIGVNRCGTHPQFTYTGRSLVVAPHGVIIAPSLAFAMIKVMSFDIFAIVCGLTILSASGFIGVRARTSDPTTSDRLTPGARAERL